MESIMRCWVTFLWETGSLSSLIADQGGQIKRESPGKEAEKELIKGIQFSSVSMDI